MDKFYHKEAKPRILRCADYCSRPRRARTNKKCTPIILVRSPQIVNRGRRFGARGSVFSCRSEAKPRPIWKKTDPSASKVCQG
jgi:hypothetical protein